MTYFDLFKTLIPREAKLPNFEKLGMEEFINVCEAAFANMQDILIFGGLDQEIPFTYPIERILVPKYGNRRYQENLKLLKAANEYDGHSIKHIWDQAMELESERTGR